MDEAARHFRLAPRRFFPDMSIWVSRSNESAPPWEAAPMSHSHLAPRHLVAQIESERFNRTSRDIRPDWLTAFLESTAALFEPLDQVGRVGFDCQLDAAGWSVALYLGAVEQVGGKNDGQSRPIGFHCDLRPLLAHFARIDEFAWTVFPQENAPSDALPRSLISLDGLLDGHRLRLVIRSVAPAAAGPGLRRLTDGRLEIA
jgi:hypothetical protein